MQSETIWTYIRTEEGEIQDQSNITSLILFSSSPSPLARGLGVVYRLA